MGGRGGNYEQSAGDWVNDLLGLGGGTGTIQPLPASRLKGLTLQKAEEYARNRKSEYLFVFNEKGEAIQGYKGTAGSVAIPATVKNIPNATVTHGHPKGVENFGGTLSFRDVGNMARSKWKEHRATASGQGEMNYIMRRTPKSNPTGLLNRMKKDAPRLEKSYTNNYEKYYSAEIKKGKTPTAAAHIARQKTVGALNKYYKQVMPKYGYEYITRKKPYDYQR